MDSTNKQQLILEQQKKIDKFFAYTDRYVQEKAELILKIQDAQLYIDNKEQVMDVLNELHLRTQARTKELYEHLLTTLLQEIKPNDPENKKVVLQTEIKRNRTALDVGVANEQGYIRNAYYDKGGSVENIIAMGLRFIAVSRTTNRRLIIMDEADCALRSEYIPVFARIMGQLSRQIGMQVIYISHHPASSFEGYARIIHFERQKGRIIAEQISDANEEFFNDTQDKSSLEFMDGIGIRYIRLVNTKQHENTLIELSPYVNIITADVDVGKSTVVQAIEAVSQNLGREGLIRDNQPFSSVEIGIEDEMTLQWTYRRKGAKKTLYSLINNKGQIIHQSDDGSEVPDWLHNYLGMEKNQDFDLHISDQHNASFILDKRISSFRRAELLSLGKNASLVQKMILTHAEKVEKSTKIINESKKRLVHVKNKLEALRVINVAAEKAEELKTTLNSITNNEKSCILIKRKVLKMRKLIAQNELYSQFINNLSIPLTPVLITNKDIKLALTNLNKLTLKKSIFDACSFDIKPYNVELKSVSKILEIGMKINDLEKKNSILSSLSKTIIPTIPTVDINPKMGGIINSVSLFSKKETILAGLNITIPSPPVYKKIDNILLYGKKISTKETESIRLGNEILVSGKDLATCADEKTGLIDTMGGICPICQQIMTSDHKEFSYE